MKMFPLCIAVVAAAIAGSAAAQSHVCGGVGVGEQQRMKEASRDHDLMLTFATSNGAYMADVAVQIRDGKGAAVVDVNCEGPIMLVDLPSAGSYRITARANGVAREQTVTVSRGKRPASATFVWPAGS
jgi:hypothetical protein